MKGVCKYISFSYNPLAMKEKPEQEKEEEDEYYQLRESQRLDEVRCVC